MQFQVPQFIESEDKIVGPLTLKQFGYVAAGGVIAFISFSLLTTAFAIMVSVPVLTLTLFLAFGKIKDTPAPKYIVNMIGFAMRPQLYLWKKK